MSHRHDDDARARALASVKEAILATDDSLGDVRRARIGARLSERLAAGGAPTAGRRWGAFRRVVLMATAAGMACLAVVGVARWWTSSPTAVTPEPRAATGEGGPARTAAVPQPMPPLATTGPAPAPAREEHIEVPAGARVRARLGDRARTTLVGPAVIDVLTSTAELIDVRLVSGTLLADYDGSRGGVLRVHAPTLTVEVVGTLFAVEAGARGTAVSVAHGRVRVTREGEGRAVLVETSQTLKAGAAVPGPLLPSMRDQLAVHQGEGPTGGGHGDRAAARARQATPVPSKRRFAVNARTLPSAGAPRVAAVESVSPPAETPALAPAIPSPVPSPSPSAPPPSGPSAPSALRAPLASPRPEPSTPSPPPVATVAVPGTAAELYRVAEAAMRRHDRPGARRLLARVVAQFPSDRLAELARYELAQLAISEGDRQAATRALETLGSSGRDPALRRAAAFARCRLDLGSGASAAQEEAGLRCLERFRAAYPAGPEDAEVLALSIAHASQRGRCDMVARLTAEYARRYPTGAFAAEASRRKHLCARAPTP